MRYFRKTPAIDMHPGQVWLSSGRTYEVIEVDAKYTKAGNLVIDLKGRSLGEVRYFMTKRRLPKQEELIEISDALWSDAQLED